MDSVPLSELSKRVSAAGWDALQLLTKSEEMSRSVIESKLHLTSYKGAEVIACLYAAGLIDYARSDNDFRYKMFKITQYGLAIAKFR